MRIAYLSTDEVNQDLAARLAARCGAVVCKLPPGSPPPDGLFDAVIYNLDDMPRDERFSLVERLREGKPVHPTAVHGYDITDEQARTLRQDGVASAPHLHFGLIETLLAAAARSRVVVPTESDSTDLTWVDLVK